MKPQRRDLRSIWREFLPPSAARLAFVTLLSVAPGCGGAGETTATTTGSSASSGPMTVLAAEAGFLSVPARDVTVKGQPVRVRADAHLFYNLAPADEAPGDKPILFLFNGFADDIVRPYGTGPMTVEEGGAVVANPSSFTRFANLVYLEPRQAGYSYDIRPDGGFDAGDCSGDVFNEYVDAADVLLAALAFLDAHPTLAGRVYWVGESYAGVRITWIVTYLRGAAKSVGYRDPTLDAALAGATRSRADLMGGQVLLEAWLAGHAHQQAIFDACADPELVAGVAASVGVPCSSKDACACADAADRSAYDYLYPNARQNQRELEADLAHTVPSRAEALLGVKLDAIDGLAAKARRNGFKCSGPDETVPSDAALVAALGALPKGQSYFVPYSPLQPGKESVQPAPLPDWEALDLQGRAFVDGLADAPAMLTQGDRDLVVPTRALAPALAALFGAARVHASASRITVDADRGPRSIDVFDYPDAGHMVTMVAPGDFARDLEAWLAAR